MKILFICTDNTCISCMAEVIFNKLSNEKLTRAFSAGIYVAPNTKISSNTVSIVKDNFNLDISNREPIQLSEEMIEDSDIILTSNYPIKELLLEVFPEYNNKIFVLNELVGIKEELINPLDDDFKIYKDTFNLLRKMIVLLIDRIKEDNGI